MELPKTVAVLGLGVSGCAVAEVLVRSGVQVVAVDEKPLEKLTNREQVQKLAEKGAQLILGDGAFERVRQLRLPLAIISPGIKIHCPEIQAMVQDGTNLWSEIELAYRLLPYETLIIAVTGTKGKTTTVHLIERMLQASGFQTILAGNVGQPFISAVENLQPSIPSPLLHRSLRIVLEVSSFQLATCHTFRPNIAALTSLFVDHLDWHTDVEDYWRAKARLFANQSISEDWAVLNSDNQGSRWMASQVKTRILWCGKEVTASCPYCTHFVSNDDDFIWASLGEGRFPVMRLSDFQLLGEHNLSNLRIAIGSALLAGANLEAIADAIRDFKGIPHRLELVAEINGIQFFNDSSATTPDASAAGIRAFDSPVVIIVGGRDKGGRWDDFAKALRERVKALVAIGEFANQLMSMAQKEGLKATVKAEGIDEAVKKAAELAKPGDVVLLSPACASFDMFANYEQRGEAFKEGVRALEIRD